MRPAMSVVTITFVQRGKAYPAVVSGTIAVGGIGDVGLMRSKSAGMGKMHPDTEDEHFLKGEVDHDLPKPPKAVRKGSTIT